MIIFYQDLFAIMVEHLNYLILNNLQQYDLKHQLIWVYVTIIMMEQYHFQLVT